MRFTLTFFALLAIPSLALAQARQEGSLSGATLDVDPRSYASSSMLLPEGGFQLGSTLNFLTSDEAASGTGFRFTDVVLLKPHARLAFAEGWELFAGISILGKQPSMTDDAVFQGADLSVRRGISKGSAAWLRANGGLMRDGLGTQAGLDGGVEARKFIAQYAAFQGALGASAQQLFYEEDTDKNVWFAELLVGGKVLFMEPSGIAGVWLGTDFHFPVAGFPKEEFPDRATGLYLNPQTRVNFRVGGVLSAIDDWDLYSELVIVDRGEAADPATMLPVLDGGFDQTQLIFGAQWRSKVEAAPPMTIAW